MKRTIYLKTEFNWEDYDDVNDEYLIEDSGIYDGIKDGVGITIVEDKLPDEVNDYLTKQFKEITQVEGEIEKITQYGGSIFVKFKNKSTYRFNLGLYNSEVTLD